MRILILNWNSFGQEYIINAFNRENCTVEIFEWPFPQQIMRENDELCEGLKAKLNSANYHFVFSLNFFPVAAKACYLCGTKYISWVYDTPYLLLYSKHIKYNTNIVYIFEHSLQQKFIKQGIYNVYYLPMAAPTEYYDSLEEKQDINSRFKSEVSFVGSTYQEDNQNMYKQLEGINSYTKGYLDGIINAQKEIYGSFLLEDLLSENVLNELRRVCPLAKGNDEWETDEWIYANYFLARKLTGIQRTEILQRLAEKFGVNLYTYDDKKQIGNVNNCGAVDYILEMPHVFKNSKININMTLRSIHSGIPLRAMEIMGCGGFLLTNYQEDFLEFFQPDEDFVYYTGIEDLEKKVEYYLDHEEERKKIADNGYRKVKEFHTYRHRVSVILQMAMTEEENDLNNAIILCENNRKFRRGCWYKDRPDFLSMPDEELVRETELRMKWMREEKDELFDLKEKTIGLVDKYLKEGTEEAYEKILGLLRKNIIKELYNIFPEIYYIYCFINIYLKEKKASVPYTLQNFDSHEQLQYAYETLVLYYRRIECQMPIEQQREIIDFICQNGFSEFALTFILEASNIIDKNGVMQRLLGLIKP